MSEFDGFPCLILWLLAWIPCIVVGMRIFDVPLRTVFKFQWLNIVVLAAFCGAWYAGFFFDPKWMRLIDLGAPWTWLVTLLGVSYFASFALLRGQSSAGAISLFGPLITVPALWFWILFCAFLFDPFP